MAVLIKKVGKNKIFELNLLANDANVSQQMPHPVLISSTVQIHCTMILVTQKKSWKDGCFVASNCETLRFLKIS